LSGEGSSKNKLLKTVSIRQDSIGWSAKDIKTTLNIEVTKGKQYLLVMSTETSKGCYGFALGELLENSTDFTSASSDMGKSFQPERQKKIKYSYIII